MSQTSGSHVVAHEQVAAQLVAVHGRPVGRRRSRNTPLHAVPGTDRTRSALCGARVGGQATPWALLPAGACPECAQLAEVRSA